MTTPDWINLRGGVVVGSNGPYASDGRYVRVGELVSKGGAPVSSEPSQGKCFCERTYPDSNPDASCGDCPTRDYKAAKSAQPADSGRAGDGVVRELVEAAREMMRQDAVQRATRNTNPFMADAADKLSAALGKVGAR